MKKAAANDSQSTAAGDPAGIRTPDTLLKRQVLCLLSYWVMRLQASKFNLPPPILRGGAGGEVPGKGALCAEVAGMAGLEPTISESKSGVLPLHYIPPSTCAERPALPASRFLGWEMGLEPTTPGTTIRCSYQLSYTHHYLRYWHARRDSNPRPTA